MSIHQRSASPSAFEAGRFLPLLGRWRGRPGDPAIGERAAEIWGRIERLGDPTLRGMFSEFMAVALRAGVLRRPSPLFARLRAIIAAARRVTKWGRSGPKGGRYGPRTGRFAAGWGPERSPNMPQRAKNSGRSEAFAEAPGEIHHPDFAHQFPFRPPGETLH
ncbi:MAG: hypothetical protein ACYC8V_14400 [Caulobacteraceae bacterium]